MTEREATLSDDWKRGEVIFLTQQNFQYIGDLNLTYCIKDAIFFKSDSTI